MTNCPFPVGFGGFFKDDPNALYEGTKWEQKKDVFILAAGDTYPAGSTGGEAQHQLTVDEMPEHRHPQNINGTGSDAWTNTFGPAITRPVNGGTEGVLGYSYPITTADIARSNWGNNSNRIYTDKIGLSQPHNNMPPYYSMPFWVRTA